MEITTNEISMIADAVCSWLNARQSQYRKWSPQEVIEYVKALQGLNLDKDSFASAMRAVQ